MATFGGVVTYFVIFAGALVAAAGVMFTLRAIKLI